MATASPISFAPPPRGGPNITVVSGKDSTVLTSFFAYDVNFTGGVYIAAGDVNGDGFADIICGADAGGGPNVTVFSGKDLAKTRLLSFFPYDINFTGGVRVASVTWMATGSPTHYRCRPRRWAERPPFYKFNNGQPQVLQSYFAYDLHFSAGIYVGAGDVNGDGHRRRRRRRAGPVAARMSPSSAGPMHHP